MPTVLDSLRARLLEIDGVLAGGSVFGGMEGFWIDAKLVAEVADSNRIGLRLTKPLIRELRSTLEHDPRVEIRKTSDWVTVRFVKRADATFVAELLALAAPLYLPPDRTAMRPPPTGADLERRRRWH